MNGGVQYASRLGMALSLAGYMFLTTQDSDTKYLAGHLPVWEVMFARALLIVAGALVVGRRRLVERALSSPLRGKLALRGLLTMVAWLCYFSAAPTLPFAQLLTIYFAAPIFVTAMSAPLLGERVPARRWACVGLGFIGVLVANDFWGPSLPTPEITGISFGLARLLALIAAGLWAYSVILMRQIARLESSLMQLTMQNAVFLVFTGLATLVHFVPPSWTDLLLMLGLGAFGAIGQFCMMEGMRRCPAAVTATLEYTALLWAFALGYLIWGDVPRLAVWIGAGISLISGVLLVLSERRPPPVGRRPG